MFREVPARFDFPANEREILRFWAEHDIERLGRERNAGGPTFVFYEGPPTANGLPHPGHVLTRVMKDLYPRYRAMCGYYCLRKGGWDTHGLPVEIEVCKELGIHSKEEIESYGVEPFIHQCIRSVFRYVREWEELTRRIGFWIDLDNAYVTYHRSYVESVWWALKTLFDRGLLYQGYKIVWWWAQGGTALSSAEVGEGYRTVDDPSIYVRCPLVEQPDLSLLVWTTTPWTLPANLYVAVRPDCEYAVVRDEQAGCRFVLAADLVGSISEKVKRPLIVEKRLPGQDLVGLRYQPPFDFFYRDLGDLTLPLREGGQEHAYWRIVAADFVTLDTGTGLVHQAPAFGEEDFELFQAQRQRFADPDALDLICPVRPNGTFDDRVGPFAGRWVKDADRDICRDLRERGLLYHQETYRHDYPFCPRAENDPLIQYPRRSWFIRTTAFRDLMLENNSRIGWHPDHIRTGRFGKFLESNVDWALSRERFWGTPLPIWVCEKTGYAEAIGSYDELLSKPDVQGTDVWERAKAANPDLPDDLAVHKPYIDHVTYRSPKDPTARMRRVPDVIDCWFDSGCMPFAQWGWPHRNDDIFRSQFPADFISEAIDQTRGWFYSLLAISTLLFSGEGANGMRAEFPHPYRNCVVLGLVLGRDGLKLSKRLRNYDEPGRILEREGADALRWYFYSAQAPWTSARFDESAIAAAQREFLIRLYNVYSFFVIYANIDGFTPVDRDRRPSPEFAELDRWILSELHRTIATVRDRLDNFANHEAAAALTEFVDALSNWYVRRSRERFWRSGMDPDKVAAYETLYECLVTLAGLIAPFCPFFAESLYQNLVRTHRPDETLSVHLCPYPQADPARVDETLCRHMAVVRELVSLGRAARTEARIKVRQPLPTVRIVLADPDDERWLHRYDDLIREELNVKQVEYVRHAEEYVHYEIRPNFRSIGPKFGRRAPAIQQALARADAPTLRNQLQSAGSITLTIGDQPITLTAEDVEVRLHARPGWTAARSPRAVVVVSTDIPEELRREGLARELIHHIQNRRKALDLNYTDRIAVRIGCDESLREAVDAFRDLISRETLATTLEVAGPDAPGEPVRINGCQARLDVRRAG